VPLESILSDPECVEASNHVDDLSDKDCAFLLKLAEFLRLTAQDAAVKADYPRAAVCREKRGRVIAEHRSRKPKPPEDHAIDDQERIVRERRRQWDDEIRAFDSETDGRVAALRAGDARDLADLAEEWRTVLVEKYRKPSAGLIRQRTLETEMIKKDQFEQARFIHGGVVGMEAREFELAQANYERDYREVVESMRARQAHDFEQFSRARESQRRLLLNRIDRETVTFMNRMNVLQTKPGKLAPRQPITHATVPPRASAARPGEGSGPGKKLPMLTFAGTEGRAASAQTRPAKTSKGA